MFNTSEQVAEVWPMAIHNIMITNNLSQIGRGEVVFTIYS